MATTFAAELGTDVSDHDVQDASLQTLRQHAEAVLPIAMKPIQTANVGPTLSPIDLGNAAGSAEFAGSIVLACALLWQAWRRRVI